MLHPCPNETQHIRSVHKSGSNFASVGCASQAFPSCFLTFKKHLGGNLAIKKMCSGGSCLATRTQPRKSQGLPLRDHRTRHTAHVARPVRVALNQGGCSARRWYVAATNQRRGTCANHIKAEAKRRGGEPIRGKRDHVACGG